MGCATGTRDFKQGVGVGWRPAGAAAAMGWDGRPAVLMASVQAPPAHPHHVTRRRDARECRPARARAVRRCACALAKHWRSPEPVG